MAKRKRKRKTTRRKRSKTKRKSSGKKRYGVQVGNKVVSVHKTMALAEESAKRRQKGTRKKVYYGKLA